MRIAVINPQTNIVENVAVAPEGSNVWFAPAGKIAVESGVANIGDTYDAMTETFTRPQPPEEPQPEEGETP